MKRQKNARYVRIEYKRAERENRANYILDNKKVVL